jgi:hypothetical protein
MREWLRGAVPLQRAAQKLAHRCRADSLPVG